MLIGPQTRLRVGVFSGEQVSYPTTGAAFLASTGLNLSALYTLQDASGAAVDSVGSNHLSTVTGSPGYRQAVSGATGITYDAAANTGHSADVNDPALSSCIFGAIGVWNTAFAASQPGVVGRMSTTTVPCCAIYRAADSVNYPAMLIKGATTGSIQLADVGINVVTPRRPVLYLGQIDRTAAVARMVVADSNRVLTNQSGSIAGFDTFTGGVAPQFLIGAGTGVIFKGGLAASLAFYATGAQCEGTNTLLTLAKRLGFGE